jgi:hypothetical protein
MVSKERSTEDTVREADGGFSFSAIHSAIRGRGHDWSQGPITRFCAIRNGISRPYLLTRYHG